MKEQIKKFLEFNGKTIYFLAKDGTWWIAIKPICEALNVDYEAQRKAINRDDILSLLPSTQTVVAADNKLREMVCLPEMYIYGWLFSIQSKSEELKQYKLECYKVLYNHFHGTITNRQNLLKKKSQAKIKKARLLKELNDSPQLKAYLEAENEFKTANKELQNLDKEIVSEQMPLWRQSVE